MVPKSEQGEEVRITADDAAAGGRIDAVLARLMPGTSPPRIQQLIAQGMVSSGGRTIGDASHRVKTGDALVVRLPPPLPAEPEGEDIPLVVVFEDAHLIVIDKKAGMVVHPAAGNPRGTLVNALIAHCGKSLSGIGGVERPGIVHRIDKDTSGLLVAAKTERAHRSLGKQFAAHAIAREYVAFVWGAPEPDSGTIDAALARDPHDRKRIAISKGDHARHARTHYETQKVFGSEKGPFAARLTCRLETGRTHQIRVHMASIGHPLIGDATYGKPRNAASLRTRAGEERAAIIDSFPRQALHAAVLGFQHPATHKTMRFESKLPADLKALEKSLGNRLSTRERGK